MSSRGLRVAGVAFLVALGLGFAGLFDVEVGVVLQGAALGVGTGLMAVGLVLVYRTTRVINFAYGAMGTACGALAAGLRLGLDWSWWITAPLCIALGVALGVLVELAVIRRFRRAPRLVLTVATIGLAQALGGLALFVPTWFDIPSAIPGFDTELSSATVRVGSTTLDGNHMALAAIAPIALLALLFYLYRTESGTAVRGVAENVDRARLLGIPVDRLNLELWAVIGGLAALTVVLKEPVQGLPIDAASGPTVLLAPLAAAVVAGMRSIWGAFLAGIAIEIIDQLVQINVSPRSWTYVVLLAIIIVALLAQQGTTGRADAGEGSWSTVGTTRRLPARLGALPEVRATRAVVAVLVVAALVLIPVVGTPTQIQTATLALVSAMAAMSLVVLTGWGGSVSLGQVALVGVGGIVAANLIDDLDLDLFLTLGLSALAGGVVAAVIGIPALRVSGQLLAVSTMAFAVALQQHVVQPASYESIIPPTYPRPELFGRYDLASEEWLYALALVLVVAGALVLANLRRTRTGRVIAATRDNSRATAAVGVSRSRTTITAFVLSGMFAGLTGGIHAVTLASMGDNSYPASASLLVFSMAVIGGVASLGGTLAGVALVQWLGYAFPRFQLLITGVGLLVILMVLPGGLGQAWEAVRDRLARAAARRRGLPDADELDEADLTATTPEQEATVAALAVEQEERRLAGRAGRAGLAAEPTADADADEAVLAISGVEAGYGSLQVLFGVDASVADGDVLALLGTNGAGKSTLFKTVAGLLPCTRGTVTLAGRDITNLPTEQIAQMGLSMMPGGRGVFPTLTVAENMRMATWMLRTDRERSRRRTDAMLAMFPVLADRWDQAAGDLSGGEQQQLSIAMAFVTEPRVVLIDELSLGLAPTVVGMLVDKVRELHADGTTIVVVEQSVNVALLMCEQAVFLEKGQVRFRGPTAGLLDRPDILRAVFIGAEDDPSPAAPPDDPAPRPDRGVTLEAHGLTRRFGGITAVDDVDLTVHPGAIVGLIGHNGAGKTTLFDLLTGFLALDGGAVRLGGVDITDHPPHRRAVLELGRSFQEALLYPSLTVVECVEVALERHLANRDPVAAALHLPASTDSERAAAARADELVALLGLTPFRDRLTGELSTGTRRIVELACLLAQDPAVVLLDEPTAGVAQAEIEALVPMLRRVQAETGCSLLVVEHDMGLLQELCDELVALEQGRVIARGTPAEVLADPDVVASYLGTDTDLGRRSGPRTADATASTALLGQGETASG
ncbi:ATP-binding cassette domain-containing protein [Iamia sp. SCSIO 61187]|uniref:ATP-binding cassette domain-containing protein n=1 Tax=Iamia sp. SCSIO 61187 TaxID=2722752 RepID=UPI001C6271B4|nr:ATP-binding cassette domain-containing protein [Iamia sp. SCSIO 61187]QYG91130.1 ATP-binding cassette domain-containing protein [Iamia sp. SCSIO 61187]